MGSKASYQANCSKMDIKTKGLVMFESERRDLAHVPRWGILRINRQQSVAEHSYFVTCYGLKIAEMIGWPDCEKDLNLEHPYLSLANYLLRHDEAECLEGDIPGPIKRITKFDSSNLKGLLYDRFGRPPFFSPGMKRIKDVADLLDECMYLAGEICSGNGYVRSTLGFAKSRLGTAVSGLPSAEFDHKDLYLHLIAIIEAETYMQKNISQFDEGQ